MADDEHDSPADAFWRFSLKLYGTEGVAPACLSLQDGAGADVNVLLFVLWAASQGRRIDAATAARIDAACRGWREEVVRPLRTARRALKIPPAAIPGDAVERLRTDVKRIELEAERLQQTMLARAFPIAGFADDGRPPDVVAHDNLGSYSTVIGTTFPAGNVQAIVTAMREDE